MSQWIKKENETRYYIGRPFEMAEQLFQFLQRDTPYVINNDKGYYVATRFEEELKTFGLEYKCETYGMDDRNLVSPCLSRPIISSTISVYRWT